MFDDYECGNLSDAYIAKKVGTNWLARYFLVHLYEFKRKKIFKKIQP